MKEKIYYIVSDENEVFSIKIIKEESKDYYPDITILETSLIGPSTDSVKHYWSSYYKKVIKNDFEKSRLVFHEKSNAIKFAVNRINEEMNKNFEKNKQLEKKINNLLGTKWTKN